jgi:hypothetical protein
MVAPVAARAASNTDGTMLLIGAGALLLLAKWGFGNIPPIPNPLPTLGRAASKTAYELTGGVRKDRTESWTEYLFEYDVPFSDKRIPLLPGLVRERGKVYTTAGPMDPGGQMADLPWVAMDIAEPDESLGEYFFNVGDVFGIPAYDVRDAPADLYQSTLGRVLR